MPKTEDSFEISMSEEMAQALEHASGLTLEELRSTPLCDLPRPPTNSSLEEQLDKALR